MSMAAISSLRRDLAQQSSSSRAEHAIDEARRTNKLNLRLHHLSSVPLPVFQLNLTELDLSSNQLTSLPATVSRLQELRSLTLTWNSLYELPSAIGRLVSITHIDLSFNQCVSPPCTTHIVQIDPLASGNWQSVPSHIIDCI